MEYSLWLVVEVKNCTGEFSRSKERFWCIFCLFKEKKTDSRCHNCAVFWNMLLLKCHHVSPLRAGWGPAEGEMAFSYLCWRAGGVSGGWRAQNTLLWNQSGSSKDIWLGDLVILASFWYKNDSSCITEKVSTSNCCLPIGQSKQLVGWGGPRTGWDLEDSPGLLLWLFDLGGLQQDLVAGSPQSVHPSPHSWCLLSWCHTH